MYVRIQVLLIFIISLLTCTYNIKSNIINIIIIIIHNIIMQLYNPFNMQLIQHIMTKIFFIEINNVNRNYSTVIKN